MKTTNEISYEEMKANTLHKKSVLKLFGIPLSQADGGISKSTKLKRFKPIWGCLCVQDSPENPCNCNDLLIWVPEEKIFDSYSTEKRNHDGQTLNCFEIISDAEVLIERVSKIAISHLGKINELQSTSKMMMKGKGTKIGGLLIGAFELGWYLGTKIDEAVGDDLHNWIWDATHDDD